MSTRGQSFYNITGGIQSIVIVAGTVISFWWGYHVFTALLSRQNAYLDVQNKLLANQLSKIQIEEQQPVIDIEVTGETVCVPELHRNAILIGALVKNAGARTVDIDLKGTPQPGSEQMLYPFEIARYAPGKGNDSYVYLASVPVKTIGTELWDYRIRPNGYESLYALADVRKSGTYLLVFAVPASQSAEDKSKSGSAMHYGSKIVVFDARRNCS